MLPFLLQITMNRLPKICVGNDGVAYEVVRGADQMFLIGPILLMGSEHYVHRLPDHPHNEQWLRSLYSCTLHDLVTQTVFLHNMFSGTHADIAEVVAANCLHATDHQSVQKIFTDILFFNRENQLRHNPYSQEQREVASIRNGDPEMLRKSIEEDYVGSVGELADNLLRSYQNLGIVLVTLASRAAIEGGVDPETAYSLSDSYIRQIEQQHVPEAAIQLARKAEFQYATLVKELKKASETSDENRIVHPKVRKCKEYILMHLHDKLRTSDVADAIRVSPNYLTNLFQKSEGMSITEYIQQEKIKLIKNLLLYSDYSYSTIAAYTGFSSQSHMGRLFKREIGMTPGEFRKAYGKDV